MGTGQEQKTLKDQLDRWAQNMTEMTECDTRIVFLEGAERILREAGMELHGEDLCHLRNGSGYRTYKAVWLGIDVGRIWLEWTTVLGGFFYQANVTTA